MRTPWLMEGFPVFSLVSIFDFTLLPELVTCGLADSRCKHVFFFVAVSSPPFCSYSSRGALSRLSSSPSSAVDPKTEL